MTNATVEETNPATEGITEEAEAQKRVSERIQEVLESEGYGLQPFMHFSEFGVVPRVRLVAIKNQDNDGQANNPENSGDVKAEDGDTPAEQTPDA